MSRDRRLLWAAAVGLLVLAAAIGSDFIVGSFWRRHALMTSLLANVLVVLITVVVVNELVERRDRQRWSLLAQSALFGLTQSARATWTALVEMVGVTEIHGGDFNAMRDDAKLALDAPVLSEAVDGLIAAEDGRTRVQSLAQALNGHYSEVIGNWAPVMIGARPYAELLDRHVELAGRLEWLSDVLAQNEPAADRSVRERTLTRSSIAAERASEFGGDEWLHDMIVSIVNLGMELDRESRREAFSIVSGEWWRERTAGLLDGPDPPVSGGGPPARAPG
jgi:hypothetical protein